MTSTQVVMHHETMKSSRSSTLIKAIFLGLGLTSSSGSWADYPTYRLTPNYANTMVEPVENSGIKPGLSREWSQFPVRVAVLDDDNLFTKEDYFAIVEACQGWVIATASVPGGGLSFTYEHSANPVGAQIVFRLRTYREMGSYLGMTLPQSPRWQYIQIRVLDDQGVRMSTRELKKIAMHELGHALGIAGHSPNRSDLMANWTTAVAPSLADINTLRIAYGGFFPQAKK